MNTQQKGVVLILFLWLCCSKAIAQQLPLFTQYSEYGGIINASHLPFQIYHAKKKSLYGAAYRDQWTKLPDRPRTMAIRYESATTYKRGVNLIYGGYILKDRIGVFQTTEIKARMGGFFRTTSSRYKTGGIAIGLNFGAGQYRVDLANLAYAEVDPILFKENSSIIYPDIGIGISYVAQFENEDYLQLGLSVPQIFGLDHTYTNDRKEFDIKRVAHYYLTGSYYKILTNGTYIEFSGWVKRVKNLDLNYDFLFRYQFSEHMWLGVGANSSAIMHTEIGTIIQYGSSGEFRLGYSYNPTFYSHSVIFGNIHEVSLSFSIE